MPQRMDPLQQYSGFYSQQNSLQIKGRPVSSYDEAKAAQIDFDGSIFFFPDLAHNKIYTKQITLDGSAQIKIYTQEEEKVPVAPTYVTKEEFDNTIQELKTSIASNEGKKDEQYQSDASNAKSDYQLSSF